MVDNLTGFYIKLHSDTTSVVNVCVFVLGVIQYCELLKGVKAVGFTV